MKAFAPVRLNLTACRSELDRFHALLASRADLSERADILPVFRSCSHLMSLIGMNVTGLLSVDRLAYEYDIFGDYAADAVIGDSAQRVYCAIEFEEATAGSILHKTDARTLKQWGRRFEHGFSQLVDWFYTFDDQKHTAGFSSRFGDGHVQFYGLLVIGRSADLTEHDRGRFRWRADRVTINSHKILCFTYDELLASLEATWQSLSWMSQTSPETRP